MSLLDDPAACVIEFWGRRDEGMECDCWMREECVVNKKKK